MVLTDKEQVINIARNVDEESLNLIDAAKLNEIADAAVLTGYSNAKAWATSVDWDTATTHPLYKTYQEIAHIYGAINLIMRLPGLEKDIKGLNDIITQIKGPLLAKGVKDMATLGTDGGASKVRNSSVVAENITYPKNLSASPYYSTNILSGRRGRG